MKWKWFKKAGWLYLPVSPAGYIITAMAIIFILSVYAVNASNNHSVCGDLYELFVFTNCTAFW